MAEDSTNSHPSCYIKLTKVRPFATSTPMFAWYGASAEDVAAVLDRGFARTNALRLSGRKHGDSLHLSPLQCPFSRP
ncbi:unnamed protein product [Urochloa humidicola]